METTLTTREFFRNPRKVADLLKTKKRITVTNAGRAYFVVEPAQAAKRKTLADFQQCAFRDTAVAKDASKRVDDIVYGKGA
ncbi:hypothetical protein GVX82_01580 [Patescibacteria group bacterium]|jgi:hypothetical protein|nr:hypothetical protein [Patescibacteria group bacterium]